MGVSTQVDWAELWSIWLMREKEQKPALDTTLDQAGKPELRRLARERKGEAAKIRLLADRADKFFRTGTPAMSVAHLRNDLYFAATILFMIVCTVALIFTTSGLFVFDSEGRVNVNRALFGVMFLSGLVILPTGVLVGYVWYRVRGGKSQPDAPWYLHVAARVLLVSDIICRIARRFVTGSEAEGQPPPRVLAWTSLPRWLESAPSLPSLLVGSVANLLALVIWALTLGGGCVQVGTTEFDFVLKTNAKTERSRYWVEFFGSPLAKLGWAVPSDEAVSWAKNADLQRALWSQSRDEKAKQLLQSELGRSEPALSAEDFDRKWQVKLAELKATNEDAWADQRELYRDEWSFFFLGLLLIYGIVPRVVLLVFYVIALSDCKRELKPDLGDEYFQITLANLLEGGRRSVAEVPAEPRIAGGVQPEPSPKAPTVIAPPAPGRALSIPTDPSPYCQRDGQIWSLGYAGESPAYAWPGELKSVNRAAVNLTPVVDSNSATAVLDQIRAANPLPGTILIWCDAIATLDERWKAFVEEVTLAMQEPSRIVIAFYNGSQLREQYENDAELVGKHISAKKTPCLKIGIPRDNLVEFDLKQASAESIRCFAARLRSALGEESPLAETNETLCREAFKCLRAEWEKLTPDADAVRIEQATQETARRLFQLYREAPNSFSRLKTRLVDSAILKRAEQCVIEHGGAAFSTGELGSMRQVLQVFGALVETAQKVKDHRGWLVAASVAGAAIATGGVAMALPVLPASATLAFFGSLPWLAGGGGLAGLMAGFGSIRDPNNAKVATATAHPQRSEALDTFIRSNCLLIAVLDSQSDAGAEIARRATAVAIAVGDPIVETSNDGRSAIDRAETALRLSRANSR